MSSASASPLSDAVIQEFADNNGQKYHESFHWLKEFEWDVPLAREHLHSRLRPALAKWDAIAARLGFRSPFPVRLPLPDGHRVYHDPQTVSLVRHDNVITFRGLAKYVSKPGSSADGAQARTTLDFVHRPELTTPEQIFEDWVRPVRVTHKERLIKSSERPDCVDKWIWHDPDAWTIDKFAPLGGVQIRPAGLGTVYQLNESSPLKLFGTIFITYLLSPGGRTGAILMRDSWFDLRFPIDGFWIGEPGSGDHLPELTAEPFEFING